MPAYFFIQIFKNTEINTSYTNRRIISTTPSNLLKCFSIYILKRMTLKQIYSFSSSLITIINWGRMVFGNSIS